MLLPPKLFLRALLVALAAAATSAQQGDAAARKPTFARVVNAAGAPLADAVVTFAGGLPHLGAELSVQDTLVVASDARGRAQGKLLPGLCYTAWATAAGPTKGASATSAVTGYFGAGALIELRCDEVESERRLACLGAEPWQQLGPLRYFAVTAFPGAEIELQVDAAGMLAVPPGPYSAIDVRSRDGQPLWSMLSTVLVVRIPPPQSVAVRVVDENGAPLAGARIRQRVSRRVPWRFDGPGGVSDGQFRDLGVTAANGRLSVVVPYDSDPLVEPSATELLLFAVHSGRPAVAGGVFGKSIYQDDQRVADWKGTELLFTSRPVEPLRGNCGPVPAGTVAHLAGVCKLLSERTSYTHDARSFVTSVAADGSFAFADVPAELHSSRLTLVSPKSGPTQMPWFPALAGRELPPEVAVLPGAPRAPLVPEVAVVRLRVTDPDGGPSRGVVALLAPGELRGVLLRDSLVRIPLDAAGSGTLSLLPGSWVLLVVSGAGYGALRLDAKAGEAEQNLVLQPLSLMRVMLRDSEGKPVAGARLIQRGSETRASGDPIESLLQSYASSARSQWGTLRTDAKGALSIYFVPVNGVTKRVALVLGVNSTKTFPVAANDTPLDLRFQ